MNKTKRIAMTAVLIALYFVLSCTIKIPFVGHIVLDMGYVALTVAAVCYGGVTAMIVGAAGCALESIVLTALGFSISWVAMNIIVGLTVGIVCFRLPDNRKWISIPTIIMAVALGVVVKTGIECVLYSIPVAVKAPKALVAFAVDSIVMILALPLAYTVKKRVKR